MSKKVDISGPSDNVIRQEPYPKTETSKTGISNTTGEVLHYGRRKTPLGSINSEGKYTGDFRGLGVVNPWGGKTRRRYRKKRRTRKKHSRRRRY
jgi:hypothetical protein